MHKKCILQNTRRGVSVGLEVVAHEAVGIFGFRFDIGRRGERFGVLQQADGRFLLSLPAAEAGGVLVMSVGGKTVRSQGNTELPCLLSSRPPASTSAIGRIYFF